MAESLETYLHNQPLHNIFSSYITHSALLNFAIFDNDLKLRAYNANMYTTFHLQQNQDYHISKLFEFDSLQRIIINDVDNKAIPSILIDRMEQHENICYFYQFEDEILMFGEVGVIKDETLARSMSDMTIELGNLTRLLKKKNRELIEMNKQIEKLVHYDELTGLYNRRYFNDYISSEIERATRHNTDFAMAICDLDHFKIVNDTYGHNSGDKVLIVFADLLQLKSRKLDMCFRYGGEEFVLAMPYTSTEEAFNVCERIRSDFEQSDPLENEQHFTVSFGIAAFKSDLSISSFIANADLALYQAKIKRNDIKVYS